ncbi:YeeE/YedE family protein [Andreprevotia chitinilytica]|uniref:YeeE/YedE family protein n=1 Tax=Andreprevotia chitinilytica TaxID=396808 RepID=UPI00054D1559|nr:YeeE/YedE family protein [Andreprevotia chitinilytica]
MRNLIAALAGLIFGLGLILSGMSNPAKVQGFLDLAGQWDPSLALVMAGAIAAATPLFMLARRRERALLTHEPMSLPTSQRIDRQLLLGSVAFGIGWGLAGICPGPAIVAAGLGKVAILPFLLAMLVGMALHARMTGSRSPQ